LHNVQFGHPLHQQLYIHHWLREAARPEFPKGLGSRFGIWSQVWELQDAGLIPDELAAIAWVQIAMFAYTNNGRSEAVS